MRSDDVYDDIRMAISSYCEESDELYKHFLGNLGYLCGDVKSKVVLDFLRDCEGLSNNRVYPLWRNELDEWMHSRYSFAATMRQYRCGEDAEYAALEEQRRVAACIEEFRLHDSYSQFQPFTGGYTEAMYDDVLKLTQALVDDMGYLYNNLHNKVEWLSGENDMLSGGFKHLVEDVMQVVLSVTESYLTMLKATYDLIGQECNAVAPEKTATNYMVAFNPKTGYVEIQLAGATKRLDLKGRSPQEIAQAIAEQIMSMEHTEINDSTKKVHINYDDFI